MSKNSKNKFILAGVAGAAHLRGDDTRQGGDDRHNRQQLDEGETLLYSKQILQLYLITASLISQRASGLSFKVIRSYCPIRHGVLETSQWGIWRVRNGLTRTDDMIKTDW